MWVGVEGRQGLDRWPSKQAIKAINHSCGSAAHSRPTVRLTPVSQPHPRRPLRPGTTKAPRVCIRQISSQSQFARVALAKGSGCFDGRHCLLDIRARAHAARWNNVLPFNAKASASFNHTRPQAVQCRPAEDYGATRRPARANGKEKALRIRVQRRRSVAGQIVVLSAPHLLFSICKKEGGVSRN